MAEPKDMKKMESGTTLPKKKAMYLRLGYTETPRRKAERKPFECPGGDQHCKDCKIGTKVISSEELLQGGPETAEVICTEPICEESCPGCPVGAKT